MILKGIKEVTKCIVKSGNPAIGGSISKIYVGSNKIYQYKVPTFTGPVYIRLSPNAAHGVGVAGVDIELNIYKYDTTPTKVYSGGEVVARSVTQGYQIIPIHIPYGDSHTIIIEGGTWTTGQNSLKTGLQFLGSEDNNKLLTGFLTSTRTSYGNIISYRAFIGSSLQQIAIPENVTDLGDYAFARCSNLQIIAKMSNITNLGLYCFSNCTALRQFDLVPIYTSRIKEIPLACFNGCTSLQSIQFPSTLTSIKGRAFGGCTSLQTVTIPSTVTDIGVGNLVIPGGPFINCTGLTTLNVLCTNSSTKAIKATYSWVYGCSSSLVIHASSTLNSTTAKTAFGNYWNYIDSNTQATVVFDL